MVTDSLRLRLAIVALQQIVASGILADEHVIQAERALHLILHATDEEIAALLAVQP